MKRLYTAQDNTEATTICALLVDAGIAAVVQGEHLGPLAHGIPVVHPEVWIQSDVDTVRAAKLILEYQQGHLEKNVEPTRLCPKCGESIEAGFTECWKCADPPPPTPRLSISQRRQMLRVGVGLLAGLLAISYVLRPRASATSLCKAAKKGDISQVRYELNKGVDVNAPDPDGWRALHYAASGHHTDIVELLLEWHADVNSRGRSGRTALQLAAEKGFSDLAETLLEKGADFKAGDDDGLTPLHYAASKGHVEIVKILLRRGATVDARSKRNGTPLHSAAYSGQLAVVELLLSKGADVNAKGQRLWTSLHYSADRGHIEIAKCLLKNGAAIDAAGENGCTPLHLAVNAGHLEMAALLLDNKANVNAAGADVIEKTRNGKTPLDLALSKYNVSIIELLQQHGGRSSEEK